MPLDWSALDAGTDAFVDGGVITDSDDQWGPWVPTVPVTVPSVSTAPYAPATATVPSLSTAPDAPTTATVPSSGPPFGYHAKRWLEYGASGSGDAANQVCCKTRKRKAVRLCQLVEVSIYVGPHISKRAVWCHETGNAAERSAGCIFSGLPACPRNRGYSRPNGGWREIAGVIAPIGARMGRSKAHCGGRISYATILCQRPRCPSAVLTLTKCANGTGSSEHYGSEHIDQRLGAGSRQTFCNGPHWDYRPINGDRGVDASKLHPKSKIWEGCPCEDARGSPPDGVHPYVAALQRDASVPPGAAIGQVDRLWNTTSCVTR